MTLARRATPTIYWQGTNISAEIQPFLLDLSYTDHLSGAADDLTMKLEDREGLWSGDWRPEFSDTAEARLTAEPWLTKVSDVRLGLFSHDSASFTGPPKTVTIRCVSAALSTGIRRHRKRQAWSGVTLHHIADDIAKAAGLTLYFDAPETSPYKRKEQKDQSDLEFLEHECADQGLALKVTERKIAIFDEHERELEPSVGVIDLRGGNVLSWSFDSGKSDHYGRCRVKCFNPRTGKTVDAFFREPEDDGPTLEARRTITTKGEAESLAKALLRQANRFASRGKLTVVGDPGLVAGVTFDLTGGKKFNGKFIIVRAEHHVVGGYTVGLDVRRTLEDY